MKKTILFLGLFILALTTALTSCNEPEPEGSNSNNAITIGNDIHEITSAMFVADEFEKDVEITFFTNDFVFNIELDGYDKIPTGTFELTREGRYTAEADMLFHDYDYEITGALTISESSNVITVTISGDAYKDRASKKFSLNFQGELSNGGDNSGGGEVPTDNSILINESLYSIRTALYYVENDGFTSELTMTFIGETAPGAIVDITLDGLNDLIPGTYDLTSEGLYQAEAATIMNDFDIIGELVVEKNGNIYNVIISGNAVEDGIMVPFALNYKGELFNANEPTGSGNLTLNNVSRDVNSGAYTLDQGMNMSMITLTNDMDTDYCAINFVFMGSSEFPIGTHQLSQSTTNGAMALIEFSDNEYLVTDGEITITDKGDSSYTITASGNAMLFDYKTNIPFSCTYEGRLFEMK